MIKNDIVSKTDENFSNGAEIKYSRSPQKMPELLRAPGEALPAFRMSEDDPSEITRINYSLEQKIYTPDDISRSDIVEDQNPYAGTLTGNLEVIRATETKRNSVRIRSGVSGQASGADGTQKFVHDHLEGNQHPMGWRNQVKTEPLLNLDVSRQWENYRASVKGLDFTSQTGTFTRLGNIDTDAMLQHGWKIGYNVPELNRKNSDKVSAYVFGDLFTVCRAHTIYYDGGLFRDSPHTVNKKTFVNGIDLGVGLEYDMYSIVYHYNIRTKDYDEQKNEVHGYGFLAFGVQW